MLLGFIQVHLSLFDYLLEDVKIFLLAAISRHIKPVSRDWALI